MAKVSIFIAMTTATVKIIKKLWIVFAAFAFTIMFVKDAPLFAYIILLAAMLMLLFDGHLIFAKYYTRDKLDEVGKRHTEDSMFKLPSCNWSIVLPEPKFDFYAAEEELKLFFEVEEFAEADFLKYRSIDRKSGKYLVKQKMASKLRPMRLGNCWPLSLQLCGWEKHCYSYWDTEKFVPVTAAIHSHSPFFWTGNLCVKDGIAKDKIRFKETKNINGVSEIILAIMWFEKYSLYEKSKQLDFDRLNNCIETGAFGIRHGFNEYPEASFLMPPMHGNILRTLPDGGKRIYKRLYPKLSAKSIDSIFNYAHWCDR